MSKIQTRYGKVGGVVLPGTFHKKEQRKPKADTTDTRLIDTEFNIAPPVGLGVETPVPEGDVAEEPPAGAEEEGAVRLASCWKAAKLLGPDSTALIANTMPELQWLVCPQYPQIGAVYE